MEVIIICDKGAAKACAQETSRYLKVKSTGDNWVRANGDEKAVAQAIWYGQTMLECLEIFPLDRLKELKGTFAARGNMNENEEIGALIKENSTLTVNLDNPDNIFVPFTADEEILGRALTHKEMRKREYRVFTSNTSLRPTLAASILRLAGFTGEEKLLLPYENDGTLAVEAALMATHKSPFAYEGIGEVLKAKKEEEKEAAINVATPSVQFLKAVQKNAKIAGVHKSINVTKAEVDWLDTKFSEKSMDIIVAHLPASSKRKPAQDAKKIAQELEYQAKYILKGTMAILTIKPEEHLAYFKAKPTEQIALEMGGQAFTLLLFAIGSQDRSDE